MSNNDDNNYKIGYGKPPKHSRFKRGKSGNLKGRTKGSKNFDVEFMEELESKVILTEKGKSQNVSKKRVVIKQLVNQAMQGNFNAAKEVIRQNERIENKQGLHDNNRKKCGVLVVNGKMDDDEWVKKYGEMKTPYGSENDPIKD